jgi:serine/threonine protein kinase
VVGQAAEQIIAGVVLSERLAVTMYGAIHRAQFNGQRNLRGLVIDPKLLGESTFRLALTDAAAIATALALDHPNIVPTVGVEAGGPDVVIVTRGVGRYVTVQDLITAARANRSQGGKLSIPVAAAIGRSAIEALAAAHQARVVHGAVHPRSVLIDEDGGVRLGDFVVGRALTTAVAQGADSAMWRGLAGYLAPELVVGENPTPGADVFAIGAMLFTMLSGEVPPGSLHATPAVERLVQRALDTDIARRYRSAGDLLENLLEAFEDDRWELADRGEVIQAAGLEHSDSNVDEATEDLLASLASPAAVQLAPIRPAVDQRAAAVAFHHLTPTGTPRPNRLDALLADLDDSREHTAVDDPPFTRDPISEVIAKNRRSEGIPQLRHRVPSLDDPDDDTPLPPPTRDSDVIPTVRPDGRSDGRIDGRVDGRSDGRHPHASDEAAAMSALVGLDDPARRVSTAAEQVAQAADKLEQAARRLERQSREVEEDPGEHVALDEAAVVAARRSDPRPIARTPVSASPGFAIEELPPVRLRSRALGIVSLLVVIGGAIGFYVVYQNQLAATSAQHAKEEQARRDAEARTRELRDAQADRGTIAVSTTPREASVWLKLGRSNLDTMVLTSSQLHRLRIELSGYQPVDTEVGAASWDGSGLARKARLVLRLKPPPLDRKTHKPTPVALPALPANLPEQAGFTPGEGPIHIETTPPGAEVWLLIGFANTGVNFPTIAGRDYELRALADGYKPGYASITADEWRDPKGDPRAPIDVAKKRETIDKHIDLEVDPDAKPERPGPKPRK